MMRSFPHRSPVPGMTIVTDQNGPCPKKPAALLRTAPLYRPQNESVKRNRGASGKRPAAIFGLFASPFEAAWPAHRTAGCVEQAQVPARRGRSLGIDSHFDRVLPAPI